MPGISPRRALVLFIFLLPCLVAAEFPPAGDFFRPGRQHFDIYSVQTKPSPYDESRPLEARARAYLDNHCSVCHQPGGVLKGSLDLRFATPLSRTGLFALSGRRGPDGYLSRLRPGRPGESEVYRRLSSKGSDAMPPLGRTSLDEPGLALIRAWIEGLPSAVQDSSLSSPPPAPARHPSSRTLYLLRERADQGVFIPRAATEPAAPPAIRYCDAVGSCRYPASGATQDDSVRDGWVVPMAATIPRGRYRLVLTWEGRTGRRILLVL